jgi:hypothetical protein
MLSLQLDFDKADIRSSHEIDENWLYASASGHQFLTYRNNQHRKVSRFWAPKLKNEAGLTNTVQSVPVFSGIALSTVHIYFSKTSLFFSDLTYTSTEG